MTEKTKVREKARSLMAEFTDAYVKEASLSITETILASDEYKESKVVLAYSSIGKEVSTYALLARALEDGKTLCLPRCIAGGIMEARRVYSTDDLSPGAYGIAEPLDDDERFPLIAPGDIDLIILPCVACDASCNRLGHGAGYYDRFLVKTAGDCNKIALCYDKLIMNEIPMEEHDMPVKAVITEKAVYRWRPNGE